MSAVITPSLKSHRQVGMVRIGLGLLLGTIAYTAPIIAGISVLLPARIAQMFPDDKVQMLALLTIIASIVSLVTVVAFGTFSDLTRSRFGSRTPWIVGGALASAIFVIPVALVDGYAAMTFWWCLVVAGVSATAAAVATILPERVPVSRRATLSAVVGVAVLVGTALGTIVGSLFVTDMQAGFIIICASGLVMALVSAVVAPDASNAGATRARPRMRVILSTIRFPRRAPDFYWALWGRLALVIGYFMVNGFQFYIFTDYLHLSEEAAAGALGLNSIIFLATALVGAAVTGPVSDHFGRRKAFVILASVLAIIAVAIPAIIPTQAGMIGFAIVGGLAFGSYYAVDAALTSEVLPDVDTQGRDLALLNTANTGGQAIAPAASAALVAIGIGFFPVFIGAIVFMGIAIACVPPIKSVR